MNTLTIIVFCTLCSFLVFVESSPISYVLVSQKVPDTRRIIRSVFLDKTAQESSEFTVDTDKSNEIEITTEKKELLKPISSDGTKLFELLDRNRRTSPNRYADKNDYYTDDQDYYSGYDKQGSDVGYMEKTDDFPTVVW